MRTQSRLISLFRELTFHRHICLVNDAHYLPEIQNRDVSKLIKVAHVGIIMQLGADGIIYAHPANDKVDGRMRDLKGPQGAFITCVAMQLFARLRWTDTCVDGE